MTDSIDDPNIYRCAGKKATVVFKRHIKFAAIGIAGIFLLIFLLFAAATVFSWGITILIPKLVAILTPVWSGIVWISLLIVSGVTAIPWYLYVLVAIPVAYYVYGLLWCLKREFIEDDWKDNNVFDIILAILTISLLVLAVFVFNVIPLLGILIACVDLVIALLFINQGVTGNDELKPHWHQFPSAYLNYRKRIKNEAKP